MCTLFQKDSHRVNSNFALTKFKQSPKGELISQPKLPDIWHCFHFNWARLMGSSSWLCGLLEWNISKVVIKSSCRCKFKSIISKYQTYRWRDWIPQEIVLLLFLERRQSLQHQDHCWEHTKKEAKNNIIYPRIKRKKNYGTRISLHPRTISKMNQPEVFKGSSNHYLCQTPGKPLPESPKLFPQVEKMDFLQH